MNLRIFLMEPLQGKTSLSKVFWLYGVLGSVLVSALGLGVDPGNGVLWRAYIVFSLLFCVYVTIATYQCAGDRQSKFLAPLVRGSAVIFLVAPPGLSCFEFTGPLGICFGNNNC